MNKRVTLKDIANATGLSVNTVSRVIAKRPYYTKAVEEKVAAAVKELGYIGNSVAASLRSGSSKTIAIVFDDFINPFYSIVTNFIARTLRDYEYDTMIFSNYGKGGFMSYELAKQVLSRKVDGIISFLQPEKKIISFIKNSGVPFIVLGRDSTKDGIDSLCSDDLEGGRIATQHLIDKGHREICYIGSDKNISVDIERFSGYKKALRDNGIEFDSKRVVYLNEYEDMNELCEKLLCDMDAKAFFCFNDIFSFHVVRIFGERGFSFPKDYSIVGYDNIQSYLLLPKILTTITVDYKDLSDKAVELMLAKINKREDNNFRILHEVSLVQGQTT